MANSKIQIKRSTANAVPSSLSAGELAYSYTSNTLYIGLSDNSGVVAIGGKTWLNLTNTIFGVANAAFDAANAASGSGVTAAFGQANTARDTANLAFDRANTANGLGAQAFDRANTANGLAAIAFDRANLANSLAATVFGVGNAAFLAANSAFGAANGKLNLTGGTVSGDLSVTGNLIVSGVTTQFDTTVQTINDPLFLLANNNTSADSVDMGILGRYSNTNSNIVYTGMMRDSTTKEWYFFEEYNKDPSVNNNIDPAGNNFTVSILNAGIRTSNIILGGVNAISWLVSVFGATNAAFGQANTARTLGNTVFDVANAAFGAANNSNTTIRSVALGGTGNTTFTVNGVLFGNGTSPVLVTGAGTEGQVLMADVVGIPIFQSLNGGEF